MTIFNKKLFLRSRLKSSVSKNLRYAYSVFFRSDKLKWLVHIAGENCKLGAVLNFIPETIQYHSFYKTISHSSQMTNLLHTR